MSRKGTYEERLKNYSEVRDRIFNSMEKLDRIRRTREKFKKKRKMYRGIKQLVRKCDAIAKKGVDPRVFVSCELENMKVKGLLDSGASVSILGHDCEKIVEKLQSKVIPIFSEVRTAGGKKYQVLGKLKTTVKYNGLEKKNRILFVSRADSGGLFGNRFLEAI